METRLTQRRASQIAASSLIMSSVFATVQQAVGCKFGFGLSASFLFLPNLFKPFFPQTDWPYSRVLTVGVRGWSD